MATARCRSRRQHRQTFEITRIFKSGPARPPITCSMTLQKSSSTVSMNVFKNETCEQLRETKPLRHSLYPLTQTLTLRHKIPPPHLQVLNNVTPRNEPAAQNFTFMENGYLTCCRVLQERPCCSECQQKPYITGWFRLSRIRELEMKSQFNAVSLLVNRESSERSDQQRNGR